MFEEKEYYTSLLSLHDLMFKEKFHLSAQNIISGIIKMQRALTEGHLDSIFKLGEMIDQKAEKEIEILSEESIMKGRMLLSAGFGLESNDVKSITGWNEEFLEEISYGLGQEKSFFERSEYQGWPTIDLPIQKRPFIKIDGRYYCFDYSSFMDNFYRVIQKAVKRADPSYDWSEVQKEASETMVANIFRTMLPGADVYQSNYYPKEESTKQMAENDLLVVYYDVVLIVEIKAGSFVWTSPVEDFDNHIRSYQALVEKADKQCKRTFDYLEGKGIAVIYNEDKTEKAQIDMTKVRDVYMISVTMDNINEITAKAEKMSFLNLECNAISLAVDDLLVYKKYFDSPLRFLHYLKHRRMATTKKALDLNDELDHLGLYIEYNFYSSIIENEDDECSYQFVGYREKLDTYFGQLTNPKVQHHKPEQDLPVYIIKILSWLEESNYFDKIRLSNYLLDFCGDERNAFSEQIEHAIERQKKHAVCSIISAGGTEINNARYTCFICVEGSIDETIEKKNDYVYSLMLYNGEEDRIQIDLQLTKDGEIKKVSHVKLFRTDIPDGRREMLYKEGRNKAKRRTEIFIREHGKVGRNDLCPCGSGKKYKRCCGG